MTNTLTVEQRAELDALVRKAETGAQWAEIARIEADLLAANEAAAARRVCRVCGATLPEPDAAPCDQAGCDAEADIDLPLSDLEPMMGNYRIEMIQSVLPDGSRVRQVLIREAEAA